MLRTATQKGRLILVVGSVAAAAAVAIGARADLMVGYGFSKALAVQKPVPPFELAAPGSRLYQGEVGDEVYWLTRTEFHSPAPFDRRLAVGDRITIAGNDGHVRHLEVIDLKAVGTPVVKIAVDAASVPLLLVTCRVVDPAKPGRQALVRFMIEAEEPKPAAVQTSQDPLGRT